ncbi:substrate binding domain-containing protein [Paraburkholderia sp. LEh10]|uniref:substrate binding domain-containing protein n=1 Tax=Paraburkholderia sp. LEh10 TaxID=2821353 RepID=UPI0028B1A4E6|nr:substrate binding domain-containing protein [Paraburkholderia sp. LEh10]
MQIFDALEEAEEEASEALTNPRGTLRVHALPHLGQYYIVDLATEYQRLHQHVQVDLTFSSIQLDPVSNGYDVSIVVAERLPDSTHIAKRLGTSFSVLCASKEYVKSYGTPLNVDDLSSHRIVQLNTSLFLRGNWVLDGPDGPQEVDIFSTPISVNMGEGVNGAVLAGAGIGLLPMATAIRGLKSGRLVRVMPQYVSYRADVFALYPSRKYLDAKTATWMKFVETELPPILASEADYLRFDYHEGLERSA